MTRTWYQGLLAKLPVFDPAWSPDVAAAWWVCWTAMLAVARELDAQGEPMYMAMPVPSTQIKGGPIKSSQSTRSQAMKAAWARRQAREVKV